MEMHSKAQRVSQNMLHSADLTFTSRQHKVITQTRSLTRLQYSIDCIYQARWPCFLRYFHHDMAFPRKDKDIYSSSSSASSPTTLKNFNSKTPLEVEMTRSQSLSCFFLRNFLVLFIRISPAFFNHSQQLLIRIITREQHTSTSCNHCCDRLER